MKKVPAAKLGSTIVVKGQAKPADLHEAVGNSQPPIEVADVSKSSTTKSAAVAKSDAVVDQSMLTNGATKSMTVKVDIATYKKLKSHGIAVDKTSQDIFVAALALYFKTNSI
jgi:hypothetical protein